MKDQRKTEIRVGITVLAGLIIFLWILGWAKNFSITPTDNTVKVKFENTSGLEIGDPVTVNGVRKGFVEDMTVRDKGVIVTLKVDNKISLKEDAAFAVSMLDLMGGKKIEISPGLSVNELNYDLVHNGLFYSDIPQVMSMLGSFQQDFSSTISDIKITLTSLNSYLTDKKLNQDIKSAMSGFNNAAQKLNQVIDENRAGLKKLTDNSAQLTEEAKNFLETNREKMNASLDDLQGILKNTDNLITKLNEFTDELKSKENTLGKIIYDEKFYNNLSQSLNQLNELTKIILEQIKDEGIKIDADIF